MGISESEAGEKRYSKPTNPIRSPRLTWSETSSKSARQSKDFESRETVSIAESASGVRSWTLGVERSAFSASTFLPNSLLRSSAPAPSANQINRRPQLKQRVI